MQNNPCKYFENCGGCKYLDLDQESYQSLKSKALITTLGRQDIDFHWPKPPNRRKITLHIDSNNKLGFFKQGSRQIVAIDSCFVAVDEISRKIPPLQKLIRSIPTKTIQKIQLTAFDNGVDALFFLNRELDLVVEQKISDFARQNNLNISTSLKSHLEIIHFNSKNLLKLENGMKLELDSNIFIQASQQGLKIIIDKIRGFIRSNFLAQISVADLYSGFGIYSFAIADLVNKLELYEGGLEMVEAAAKNAKINAIQLKAHQRDLFNFPVSREELKKTDLAIINPPRNGAQTQIQEITKSNLRSLIYVSCNPKTFMRDFSILESKGFKIAEISAIDQFYSTDHFEIIAIIQKS